MVGLHRQIQNTLEEMGMTKKFEAIIEGTTQKHWEQMMKEAGLVDIEMSQESLSIVRLVFSLGVNAGQGDMMDSMREIYNMDIDLFEEFFNEDEDSLLQ